MDRSFAAELPRPAQRHYRLIVVSPHLDDAVFSCAGRMSAARREGPVLVVNVFSRFAADVRARGVVLGEHRHAEEAAAAQLLGFESLCLDALDVSFRDLRYRSLPNIFGPPVEADLAWRPALSQVLADLLSGVSADELLLPLGVGWHVDHVLAHQMRAGQQFAGRVGFYEDIPYALVPHAVRFRLNDLGPTEPTEPFQVPQQAALPVAWLQASQAFWRTAMVGNLRPWLIRQAAKPVVAAFLLRQMWRHRWPVTSEGGRALAADVLPLDGPATSLKIQAMQCYASQFREFFLSGPDCAAQLRHHAALQSLQCPAAERVWAPADAACSSVEKSDTQVTQSRVAP